MATTAQKDSAYLVPIIDFITNSPFSLKELLVQALRGRDSITVTVESRPW
ncbi:MAG: hypothetical protein RIG62_30430 [Cyclobacteriaceae bacterium]